MIYEGFGHGYGYLIGYGVKFGGLGNFRIRLE